MIVALFLGLGRLGTDTLINPKLQALITTEKHATSTWP